MRVQIICEHCNSKVELVPKTQGQHANIQEINDYFKVSDININADVNDDMEIENKELDEIRIDCNNCDNYIVLNSFPSNVYRY